MSFNQRAERCGVDTVENRTKINQLADYFRLKPRKNGIKNVTQRLKFVEENIVVDSIDSRRQMEKD